MPNQGVFLHVCLVNFCFGVESFSAEKMDPLTKIGMEKMPLSGNNLAWSKTCYKLTHPKVGGTHVTVSILLTKYLNLLRP